MSDVTCLECNGDKFVLLCAGPHDCRDFPDGCLVVCRECDGHGVIPAPSGRPSRPAAAPGAPVEGASAPGASTT